MFANKLKSTFTVISIALGLLLIWQWANIHSRYMPNVNQLNTNNKVSHFLSKQFEQSAQLDTSSIKKSSVGLFIESLKFSSANDVEVSGHVWQKIPFKSKDSIKPGIIFVDAVGVVTLEKRYSKSYDSHELHGWYFEVILREPFSYSDYPIDHKTVWIKIKQAGFNLAQVMVPDLNSYEKTGSGDIFGISPDIVLLGWNVNETFFDYTTEDYDTDFGFKNIKHHTHMPVLSFNVVLNRNFVNAFMMNVTLLLVMMFLLYILVVMITSNDGLKEEYELSVGSAVASCTGLFFAILMAHIHLREMFPSSGFIYLEFFYLLNYFYIASIAMIVFIFYKQHASNDVAFFKDDAVWVKSLYWPVYFGAGNIYTYIHFG